MKHSYVYILQHKTLPMIKIGKADNVKERIEALGFNWLDTENSLIIKVSHKDVFKLEGMLHKAFKKRLAPEGAAINAIGHRDGYTEWFVSVTPQRVRELLAACDTYEHSIEHMCRTKLMLGVYNNWQTKPPSQEWVSAARKSIRAKLISQNT